MLSDSGLMDLIDQEYKRKVEENRRYIKNNCRGSVVNSNSEAGSEGPPGVRGL